MRRPAIHITLETLQEILDLSFKSKKEFKNTEELALEIFKLAKNKGVRGRYLIQADKPTRQKIKRTLEAETPLVEKFNRTLHSIRLSLGHKSASIYKSSKDYLNLKEIAKLVEEFMEQFKLKNSTEAMNEYIKIGLSMMGKRYSLNKFKYYHGKILERYEKMECISNDSTPDDTMKMYKYYLSMMTEYSGIEWKADTIEKYVCMVYAKEEADEEKADYEQWIRAQFEQLAFMEIVPECYQIFGENALIRYSDYVTKNKKKKVKSKSVTNYKSKAEESYFDKI